MGLDNLTIHHPDLKIVQSGYDFYKDRIDNRLYGGDREFPEIKILKNGKYVIHHCLRYHVCLSAWNEEESIDSDFYLTVNRKNNTKIYKTGFIKPPEPNQKPSLFLKGNYAAFCNWFQNNYGHTLTDSLPYLTWLKSQVPKDYKFLLCDTEINKNFIKTIDPEFYSKIEWIKIGEAVSISGNLLVSIPDKYPCIMSKNFMNYFRSWVEDKLPDPKPNNHEIVYYYRHPELAKHGRLLNNKNEEEIIKRIRSFFPDKKIFLYTVYNFKKNRPYTVREQIDIFRSARLIIGPHGTGLTNIMWTYSQYDNPVNFLEFVPGPKGYSSQVQGEFVGYFCNLNGLPINYNIILYEPQSTAKQTWVNLNHLERALKKVLPNI